MVKMYFLECDGLLESDSVSKNKFVQQESSYFKYVGSSNIIDHAPHAYQTVMLFNNEYHRSSTIKFHIDELFRSARKYFQFLNKAARNSNISSGILNSDYQDFGLLRRCISDFFNHIRNALLDIHYIINNNGSIEAQPIVSDLKIAVSQFRLMLKSIDTLPDFVIRNSTSEIGNQCVLASFHLFHSHLELHWLHLVISLNISLIENMFKEETLVETEEDNFQSFIPCTPVYNTSHSAEIEKEIDWILYNLILLSCKCHDKVGAKHIFSCNCVKQIWISTQMLIENLNKENNCEDFWHYYNGVFKRYVLLTDKMDPVPKRCDSLYVMNKIECNNRLEFSLSLLLHVVQLQGYNSEGEYTGIISHRIVPNFTLLEDMLKLCLTNEQGIPESLFREQMRQVLKLLTVWWEPKNEVVTLLWEYFHKRLNSAFSIPAREDNSISLASSSIPSIANDLKSRLSMDCSSKRDSKSESSFSLFVTLLGIHLKKSMLSNQSSNCQRIKGRILPKFTISKIQALNELGLKHFSTLFLMMAVSTDLVDICSKLQGLITQMPFDTLPWNKKQIVLKTHLSILYLYVEGGVDISQAAKPLLTIANKYSSMRDTEPMAILKMLTNGLRDIMEVSQDFKQNEHILIDSWLTKYLIICTLPDLSNTLESFSSLLSKLRILCSYHDGSANSVSGMMDVFFLHIFSCIKTLYSNGIMALQIADTAFGFTKFVFDGSPCVKKYDSFEDVLKFFTFSDTANERVTRHYLLQVLQDDQISQSLREEKKPCASYIIHCWVKVTFLSTEGQSDDDTHLMLLMCQLPEFSALNFTPSYDSGDQRNLCKFFHAIGVAWNNTQIFQEKCHLRVRVNQYLNSMDKYVLTALKAPPSLEYVMQLFIVLGTMFLHCSPIIYSRAKPSCLLHTLISNVLLPPQLFMEKKIHPYTTLSICKSWYMFMRGLYNLDHKNDIYIEKTMKDMIVQYLPYFANKTIQTKNNAYEISHRMIPGDVNSDLQLEKYILDKISVNFITCRGKQCNVHAAKALAIIHHLSVSTSNISFLRVIINSVLLAVCEQFMFSEAASPNKQIASQILESLCDNKLFKNVNDDNIRNDVKEMLYATCKKHLAFNSAPFFKLLLTFLSSLVPIIDEVLAYLDSEISKVEKMRGVGFDHGLRSGLNEIISSYSKIKTQV